jgi:hypothetical protein
MLVQQIDAVCPEALQHAVDCQAYMAWLAVEAARHPTSFGIDVPAEPRGDHHLIANGATASPRIRSTSTGPYASAASKNVTPRS